MSKIIRIKKFYVKIFDTRQEMGACAAFDIIEAINQVLSEKDDCNIIFAAAPSQNEVLSQLANCSCVDFSRVNAFHMDEYLGLEADAPQGFANFLRKALFNNVKFKSVNCLDGTVLDVRAECERYSALLQKYPVDIVCMGIGENGHIAFNDPPVADFEDAFLVKQVELDEVCRNQQVHDGCFASLNDVPTSALTLTVPALIHAAKIFCVVPSSTKAQAVQNTLIGDVSTSCPASILRNHPHATLYLDADSSSLL
ncbi:MAG: glucosamine-6-phosphate deaminase [Ruthenibacterium sp.]